MHHPSPAIAALVLLLAGATNAAAQSRAIDLSEPSSSIAAVPVLKWMAEDPEMAALPAADIDFATFTRREWNEFRLEAGASLLSSDTNKRAEMLRDIITAAIYYPDEAKLNRITMRLYDVYRFDSAEHNRIMALAALSAIGKDASMRILATHVRWETSPRVRRLTVAAVRDYYDSQRN